MALYEMQIPAESILDLNGRQTYLGNSFVAATDAITLAASGVEYPILVLKNPSVNKKAGFVTKQMLSCLTSSGNVVFKFYKTPTLGSSAGEVDLVETNLRLGSGTAAVLEAIQTPEVSGTFEVQKITTVADVGKSLNNTYFLINSVNPAYIQKGFYVWFDVDSGGSDPSVAGKTGVKVAISENDTAETIATAVAAALDALTSDFDAVADDDEVTITCKKAGLVTAAADGTAATGFTFAVETAGALNYGTYLGLMVSALGNATNEILMIVEPGQKLLVTATASANTMKAAAAVTWFEI